MRLEILEQCKVHWDKPREIKRKEKKAEKQNRKKVEITDNRNSFKIENKFTLWKSLWKNKKKNKTEISVKDKRQKKIFSKDEIKVV